MSVLEMKIPDNKEFNIQTAGKDIKILLQSGFFCDTDNPTILHRHKYTEVHFSSRGKSDYFVENEMFTVEKGEFFVIPGGMFHRYVSNEYNTRHCAFQVSLPTAKCEKIQISPSITENLLYEIEEYKKSGRSAKVEAYIGVICAHIVDGGDNLKNINDRDFLIHEYLVNNYNRNITLSDLAQKLNLSEKQAERVVRQSTGNTFRKELNRRRIEAAMILLKEDKLTMSEVAERVGYQTYSGFWKAYSKKIKGEL